MALYVRGRVDQGGGGVRFPRDMHVCCTEFNLISEIPSPSSTPFRWAFTGMGQRSIFPPRPARETHRHAVGAVEFQYCRHARVCEYHLICKWECTNNAYYHFQPPGKKDDTNANNQICTSKHLLFSTQSSATSLFQPVGPRNVVVHHLISILNRNGRDVCSHRR